MIYRFYIETITNIVEQIIDTTLILDDLPFGVVGYRRPSSSTRSKIDVQEFWNIVDKILFDNDIQITHFVRVIKATRDNTVFGEQVYHS